METSLDVPFQPQNTALGHLIAELFNLRKIVAIKLKRLNAKQCPLQIEHYMYCIMIITTSIYLAYLVFEGYVLLKFVTKWWLNCFNS